MFGIFLVNLPGFGLGGGGAEGGGNQWTGFVVIAVLFAGMYFMTIAPQRKRQKEEQAMRDNLQIGDEVTTIGGIMGRVVTVKEDSIIIETGADRTKLRMLRTSIAVNNTAQEKLQAERDAAKRQQEDAQRARMEDSGRQRKKSRKKDE